MKQQTPFHAFIDLISFDQDIKVLQDKVAALEQEIVELADQEKSLQSQLSKAYSVQHDARKEVDALELQMKELDEREQDRKRKLDFVASPKEYNALDSEIKLLKQQQHELEDALVAVWNAFETAQTNHDQLQAKLDEHMKTLQATIGEKRDAIAAEQKDIDEKLAVREVKEKPIPDEWLEKYTLMRARVTDPVVPVEDGSCTACSHIITDQELIQLGRNKLLQCKECFRLIYLPSKHTEEQPEQQAGA